MTVGFIAFFVAFLFLMFAIECAVPAKRGYTSEDEDDAAR